MISIKFVEDCFIIDDGEVEVKVYIHKKEKINNNLQQFLKMLSIKFSDKILHKNL